MNFTHLHVHSHFSRIDGIAKVRDIVDKCIATGMNAVALTDHGNMCGIKELLDYCKFINAERSLSGIKSFVPIVGIEAYCARRGRHLMTDDIDRGGWHVILLAKNKTGYQNLCRLVWESNEEDAFYIVPRIDHELLEQYHEGLICCSACIGGELPQKVLNGLESGDMSEARKTVEWFQHLFGEDYYIELQRHETQRQGANREIFQLQSKINPVLIDLAHEYGVKIICSNDSHFLNKDEADAQDCWMCIKTNKFVDDKDRIRFSKQEWLKTPEEMEEIFRDIPETLSNTQEIVDKIALYDIDHAPILPKLELPLPPKDYLRQQVKKGGIERYGEEFVCSQAFKMRADAELSILCSNEDAVTYLLIVADVINAARDMGIVVGPGRGSAAGSLVNYCLKITDIDPLKYGLLFERFYSDTNILPDIDIDFEDCEREKVVEYLSRKYGNTHVAHIITYGRLSTKSALADVSRVQQIPLSRVSELKNLIPVRVFPENIKDANGKSPKVNLRNCYKYIEELKREYEHGDPNVRSVLEYAAQLEGAIRQVGIHACGVIIGADDLTNFVPLSYVVDKNNKKRVCVTEYDGHVIESVGLIKMDILGLVTLTLIKECLHNIRKAYGIDLDINTIPENDKETLRIFQEGQTVGLFQFEPRGVQNVLRELHPDNFEELVAVNTMYRPGTETYIQPFINRKRGIEPISYELPVMEKYLKETYGLFLYQEQLMQICQEVAGFTPKESNQFRKDSGRLGKSPLTDIWKRKFIDGGIANGYDELVLFLVWDDIKKSALFAFVKAHAACYTWLAYQVAYLKAHYPLEFLDAYATIWERDVDGIKLLEEELRSITR